jgi:hypothetical protein
LDKAFQTLTKVTTVAGALYGSQYSPFSDKKKESAPPSQNLPTIATEVGGDSGGGAGILPFVAAAGFFLLRR